jgi:catechol-2,3-dioxygenase
MQIQHITVYSASLQSQIAFYQRLQLPIIEMSDHQFTLQIGHSRLTFRQAQDNERHVHHIAFNISEHLYEQAIAWAQARVDLLPYEGSVRVDFTDSHWNAHSLYFADPAGNILEFIARHNLRESTPATNFDQGQIKGISEIGLAAPDASVIATALTETLGIPVFSGDPHGSFCALGDDEGLLLAVQAGRMWMPTDNVPSGVFPVEVTVLGTEQRTLTMDALPYTVHVVTA